MSRLLCAVSPAAALDACETRPGGRWLSLLLLLVGSVQPAPLMLLLNILEVSRLRLS